MLINKISVEESKILRSQKTIIKKKKEQNRTEIPNTYFCKYESLVF